MDDMGTRPNRFAALLKVHLVIAAWGLTAALGKAIAMPPLAMLLWRVLLAWLGFWILARRQPVRMPAADRLRWLFLGGLLGLHWVFFFVAGRVSTASISLVALPTAMLWCSLLEPLLLRRFRWSALELGVSLVMIAAVMLIFHVEFSHVLGFGLALLCAAFAAFFALGNKHSSHQLPTSVLGQWQMAGAFVVCLISWLLGERSTLLPSCALDVLLLLVFAWLCTVWAYEGYMQSLRKLPLFTINVIYNLEPIYGILVVSLVFGSREWMSAGFYIGACIIIGSVLMVPWLQRRSDAARNDLSSGSA
jgi:drug/metabolite transporter (DMT)-like permease